jgi:hypothetical protein
MIRALAFDVRMSDRVHDVGADDQRSPPRAELEGGPELVPSDQLGGDPAGHVGVAQRPRQSGRSAANRSHSSRRIGRMGVIRRATAQLRGLPPPLAGVISDEGAEGRDCPSKGATDRQEDRS